MRPEACFLTIAIATCASLASAQSWTPPRIANAHEFAGPESRGLQERCLVWGNEGPPMLPPGYNSYLQFVQTPGYVTILQEMIHDARIIPVGEHPHLPQSFRALLGDSRGRWE